MKIWLHHGSLTIGFAPNSHTSPGVLSSLKDDMVAMNRAYQELHARLICFGQASLVKNQGCSSRLRNTIF